MTLHTKRCSPHVGCRYKPGPFLETQKARGKAGWLLTRAFWGRTHAVSKGPDSVQRITSISFLENLFVLLDSGYSALTEVDLDEAGETPALQLVHQIDESVPFFDHMVLHRIHPALSWILTC